MSRDLLHVICLRNEIKFHSEFIEQVMPFILNRERNIIEGDTEKCEVKELSNILRATTSNFPFCWKWNACSSLVPNKFAVSITLRKLSACSATELFAANTCVLFKF